MKPKEGSVIESGANKAVGQLSSEQQEMVYRLGSVARELLLGGVESPHKILELLSDLDPKAKEALEALKEIP